MSDSTSGPDLFNLLADEFADRYRRGERPSLSEYTEKHPELAEQIQELFPALVAMEQFGTGADQATGTFAAGAAAAHPLPERLGDYRILREIARGGMGVVYEAVQESLGRHVALKVLPHHRMADPGQLERFKREARAAAMLHHTNIVPVFGVGEDEGMHFYAMQFIQGQGLDAVLREVKRLRGGNPTAPPSGSGHDSELAASVAIGLVSGQLASGDASPAGTIAVQTSAPKSPSTEPFTPASGPSSSSSSILGQSGSPYYRSVARIGVQAAEALAYAHHQKLLHRDIKPSNLLVDLQGTVWVTDFGLAKAEGTDALTHTGDIVGTLRYMAPERFQGQADARSDVYALGLTLYEMLTLEPAFAAEERARLITKILHEEPPNPRQLDLRIPRDLETIVLKAMAKERSGRYATASELSDELRRFLENRSITARRPSLLDRAAKSVRRHRAAVAAGAAGLLVAVAILAGGIGWIVRDRAARLETTAREVNRALSEATTFQGRARWLEALEAAKRAEGFLAVGGSETLRQRVSELRDDLEMVLLLEEIWLPRPVNGTEGAYDYTWADASYAKAFRDYGIDVEGLELVEAAQRIRARTIRLELVVALDSWTDRRMRARTAGDVSWKRLLAVARAADPDTWRNEVRDALAQRDFETLTKLAASAQIIDLPAQTLSLISSLLDAEHGQSLLRRAQREHPDDFWINFQLAWALEHAPPPHKQSDEAMSSDEAIRFYTAALAIHPRNAPTAYFLGEALRWRGRMDEAIADYRKAIELDRDFAQPYVALLDVLQAKGKRDEAIVEIRRATESRPNNTPLFRRLARVLAISPDSNCRDPRLAVELGRRAVESTPKQAACWNALGVAQYRAGDWRGAIAAMENSIALGGQNSHDGFFLAMSHWQLDEREQARRWYDQAVQWMEKNKPNDGDLRRFRAEAAEVLGIRAEAARE